MNNLLQTQIIRPLPALFVFLTFLLAGCSSSSSGGSCELIANANGPAFFEVDNQLNNGLSWELPPYPLVADMKPGECTRFGVAAGQYTAELQQCNIGGGACTSTFGPVKLIVFTVSSGDTYTLDVTSNTFN